MALINTSNVIRGFIHYFKRKPKCNSKKNLERDISPRKGRQKKRTKVRDKRQIESM